MERRERRSFTEDYKRQAVDLVASSRRSIGSAAKELGLRDSVLRRWVEQTPGWAGADGGASGTNRGSAGRYGWGGEGGAAGGGTGGNAGGFEAGRMPSGTRSPQIKSRTRWQIVR